MKKHYNELLDETYYEEELANGLKIIIFHKKDFHMTSCAFGTPYGAFDIKERSQGKEYNFHPGIAHFLEHKLFESDHGDVMNDFFSMGASVNAFTSYRETVYYFNMTGDNIDIPLNLLLDFVQNLNITHESVEKEKGIINQELFISVIAYIIRISKKLLHFPNLFSNVLICQRDRNFGVLLFFVCNSFKSPQNSVLIVNLKLQDRHNEENRRYEQADSHHDQSGFFSQDFQKFKLNQRFHHFHSLHSAYHH